MSILQITNVFAILFLRFGETFLFSGEAQRFWQIRSQHFRRQTKGGGRGETL